MYFSSLDDDSRENEHLKKIWQIAREGVPNFGSVRNIVTFLLRPFRYVKLISAIPGPEENDGMKTVRFDANNKTNIKIVHNRRAASGRAQARPRATWRDRFRAN